MELKWHKYITCTRNTKLRYTPAKWNRDECNFVHLGAGLNFAAVRHGRTGATGRCNKINLYWEYVLQYKRVCLNKVKDNNDTHLVVCFRQCSPSPQGSGGAGRELSAAGRPARASSSL